MTVINIKKHLKILGVSKLKEKQKEIINNVLSKRDVIGILPTGYGKSMCYILPHLIYNKNVIVISPLISLMSDQHSKLVEKNIFTINFNSSNKINLFDLNKIKNKELSGIFYFSPESFLSNESFIKDILNNTCLISIDECHCITTWNDFRSSYTKLNLIKKWIKESNEKIPVLALSATATKDTINKIYKKLNLKNAVLITTSFFKSNLSISIKEKEGLKSDLIQITKLINDCENKSIIYCKTQKETVELSDKLNSSNIKSVYYHGGMSSKTRETSQKKFSEDKVDVIIATIAFGMGIDISNIGLIIHYGISKDIESYYQEIGRAGRDGNEAKCVLFWRKKDFTLNRHFLGDMKSEISQNEQLSKIITIEKFIFSNECRMKYILKYFGEEFEKCNKCDNCLKNKITTKLSSIGTYYTYVILKTYKELGYGCGSNTVESILFGSKSKKVNSKMRSLSTYGILKKKSKSDDIPNKVRKLLYENLLDEKKTSNCNFTFYQISEKGLVWLHENKSKIEKSINTIVKFAYTNKKKIQNKVDEKKKLINTDKVYNSLKEWRYKISIQKNVPQYCVLSNKTLENIFTKMPVNLKELEEVKGVGKMTIKNYGSTILELLVQ